MAPFWKRLTQEIPDSKGKEVIWIHGVSVGEIKSSQSLFHSMRASHPAAFFLITTTTTTGQAEARRSLREADAICYLPIDFPWLIAKWVEQLKPRLFLLIETDIWPFLLRAIHRSGGKNILVSGKLSEKSARRFQIFSYFSKRLFALFDLICVQNEEYLARFLPLMLYPSLLQVGGNLKLDIQRERIDQTYWKEKIEPGKNSIAITCSHPDEEVQILDLLYPHSDLFFFLAPRHPHRFDEVALLLEKRSIPYCRFSRLGEKRGGERVILMDEMGKLSICYALSRLAIVCGSFVPIGGHNILEPCLYGIPVLFGPHMHTQSEFVKRVLEAGAGHQVELNQLFEAIQAILNNVSIENQMQKAAAGLIEGSRGARERTLGLMRKVWE